MPKTALRCFVVAFLLSSGWQSASAATRTFTGPGNFSNPANWNTDNTVSGVPQAGDDLIIIDGCTFDDSALSADYASLRINGQVDWNGVTNLTHTLSVTTVSTDTGGLLDMTGGGTLKLRGAGTPLPGSALSFFAGSGTIEYAAASGQYVALEDYHNITIDGTATASDTFSVFGKLKINAGGSLTSTSSVTLENGSIVENSG